MLTDHEIEDLVRYQEIRIEPWDLNRLGPVSYDLTTYQETNTRGVRRLVTKETIELPDNVVGLVMLRSRAALRGVFASFGPLVDPGYKGKLIFLVWKPENPNDNFEVSDLFQIAFFRIDRASVPYNLRSKSTAMNRIGFEKEEIKSDDIGKLEDILTVGF